MDITLTKGLKVLEFLARAGGPMRLSAIAVELGLQKSNVHRLLSTFVELGYVLQEPATGRYYLTLKVWEFGSAVLAAHPAKRAAMPYMQKLHTLTLETVNLTVLADDDVLYLDKVLAPRFHSFTSRPGARVPAALTASGKAMLAYSPDAEAIIERTLNAAPGAMVLDKAALMAELESVRRKGYVISRSIRTRGVVSVAAPIMTQDGKAAAALSVSAPEERLNAQKIQNIVEAVLDTCARIAEAEERFGAA